MLIHRAASHLHEVASTSKKHPRGPAASTVRPTNRTDQPRAGFAWRYPKSLDFLAHSRSRSKHRYVIRWGDRSLRACPRSRHLRQYGNGKRDEEVAKRQRGAGHPRPTPPPPSLPTVTIYWLSLQVKFTANCKSRVVASYRCLVAENRGNTSDKSRGEGMSTIYREQSPFAYRGSNTVKSKIKTN